MSPNFNAGVFVAHLGRWREQNATAALEGFQHHINMEIAAHRQREREREWRRWGQQQFPSPQQRASNDSSSGGSPVLTDVTGQGGASVTAESQFAWAFGTQPPMHVVFGANFDKLPVKWNFEGQSMTSALFAKPGGWESGRAGGPVPGQRVCLGVSG